MESFIDELIKEAEEKEELRTAAYYDLLLLEIGQLQNQIADNFSEVEKEIDLLNRFVLSRNSIIQNKIDWISKKLEAYIREKKVSTIELPHGTLKMHKKPDKVEISNMELFLKNAKKEMLTEIPIQIKPDLTKLKSYIKSNFVPKGISVIKGEVSFSYKLRKDDENGRTEETGNIGTEPADTNEITLRRSA